MREIRNRPTVYSPIALCNAPISGIAQDISAISLEVWRLFMLNIVERATNHWDFSLAFHCPKGLCLSKLRVISWTIECCVLAMVLDIYAELDQIVADRSASCNSIVVKRYWCRNVHAPYVTGRLAGRWPSVQTDPAGTWFAAAPCMVHCTSAGWPKQISTCGRWPHCICTPILLPCIDIGAQ
jgi:hypothetical protein